MFQDLLEVLLVVRTRLEELQVRDVILRNITVSGFKLYRYLTYQYHINI